MQLATESAIGTTAQTRCDGESAAIEHLLSIAHHKSAFDREFELSGNLKSIKFRTVDGTVLRGLEASSLDERENVAAPRGAILLVQGGAMLAGQMASEAQSLSQAQYDVFWYDFRGFGHSGGTPSFQAIASDYEEIITALHSTFTPSGRRYDYLFVYAVSVGGAIALQTEALQRYVDGVVLDSVPAVMDRRERLLGFLPVFSLTCPDSVQPLNRLPTSMTHYLWYQGEKDRVVPYRGHQREALKLAQHRGAKIVIDAEAKHAFSGSKIETDRRLRAATSFFNDVVAHDFPRPIY